MSTGGVKYIAGSGPYSAGGKISVKPPVSVEVGKASSQVDLKALAGAGWLDGSVKSVTTEGTLQVQTRLGLLSLQVQRADLEVGARLKLSFDAETGRVSFQSLAPGLNEAPPNSSAIMTSIDKPGPLSTVPAGLNQSLLGTGDVGRVMGSSMPSDVTIRALNAVFPHMNANSFALVVALFPMVVRGGVLAGLAARKAGAGYNGDTRLMALARRISAKPIAPLDAEFGYLTWQMPFFHNGTPDEVEFLQRREAPIEDPENEMVRTILRGSFGQLGRLEVDVLLDSDLLTIELFSDLRPSDDLMADLDRIVSVFGVTFDFRVSLLFKWGEDAAVVLDQAASQDQR